MFIVWRNQHDKDVHFDFGKILTFIWMKIYKEILFFFLYENRVKNKIIPKKRNKVGKLTFRNIDIY